MSRSPQRQALIDRSRRFVRFGLVGASGVVVNQSLLVATHGGLGWSLVPASLFSIESAIISNFVLSSVWIWRYDYGGSLRRMFHKFLQYQAATLVSSLGVNASVLAALVYWFDVDYRIANLFGIAAGMGFNFVAGEYWVFRSPSAGSGDSETGDPDDPAPRVR